MFITWTRRVSYPAHDDRITNFDFEISSLPQSLNVYALMAQLSLLGSSFLERNSTRTGLRIFLKECGTFILFKFHSQPTDLHFEASACPKMAGPRTTFCANSGFCSMHQGQEHFRCSDFAHIQWSRFSPHRQDASNG